MSNGALNSTHSLAAKFFMFYKLREKAAKAAKKTAYTTKFFKIENRKLSQSIFVNDFYCVARSQATLHKPLKLWRLKISCLRAKLGQMWVNIFPPFAQLFIFAFSIFLFSRPTQQGCSSVLQRVGQLATGGEDRGCSSIYVLLQLFCCTVLVMTTGQSRLHCQKICIFCHFLSTRVYFRLK